MGKGDRKTKRGKIRLKTYGVRRKKNVSKIHKIDNSMLCCYCGEPMISSKIASKEKKYPAKGETVDHVPQQCLFDGYGPEYSVNRLTVPSCRECNDNFAKIESDLRDLIGIANDKNDNQIELTKSGVKSILRQKNGEDRLHKDENGYVRGVEFDLARIELNHIKNFKGLYYKEFNSIVPKDYIINVIDQPSTHIAVNYILSFMENNAIWKKSGHEDIFRYKIVPYKNNNGQVVKADRLSNSIGVFCLFDYHKSILILVIGLKNNKLIKKI
jgi:ribosomal small subunit protein bTHX